ncbi:MAG: flavodoxin family protein [Ruminococcaceae bacterium]|nr:flavodoxin family protein [Oscillospiraceae bacterium]
MKVIAINGSPKAKGNTYSSLAVVCEELNKNGIETEIIQIGNMNLTGCKACGYCGKNGGKCVFNDGLNEIAEKVKAADGLIVGSPVYYAGINGTVKSFLDRLFFTSSASMRFKAAAALVALRRSGGVAALEEINRYFLFSEMIITPTRYWSVIHGGAPGEAAKDEEGMQIARNIGNNMAYILKMKEAAESLEKPVLEDKIKMGFIR